MFRLRTFFIVAFLTLTFCGIAAADSVAIGALKDNSLYEDPAGLISNGVGETMYLGRNGAGVRRRCVIAFDVAASIPSGSTITGVTLTLHVSQANGLPIVATLHRLLADWGEGESDAGIPGGAGAPSMPGDATWIHRFYDTDLWAGTGGGEFTAASSGATSVGGPGFYDWGSTSEMVSDVQSWLDAPAGNFGWLVKTNEIDVGNARRLDTHENLEPAVRPVLTIEYAPPFVPGDANCSGGLDSSDVAALVVGLVDPDAYSMQFPGCDPLQSDFSGDGVLDGADIGGFVSALLGG